MSESINVFPKRELHLEVSDEDQKIIDRAVEVANTQKIAFDYMTAIIVLGVIKSNPLRSGDSSQGI